MRTLTLALALLLSACGATSAFAPSAQPLAAAASHSRVVATVAGSPSTWTYTLTSVYGPSHFAYPSGFSPPCPSNSLVIWAQELYRDGAGNAYQYGPTTGPFGGGYNIQNNDPSQPTGFEPRVGYCHAAYGDSLTATLTVNYGNIAFSTGQFLFIYDGKADDAGGSLVIRDNTTGYSATLPIYYSI